MKLQEEEEDDYVDEKKEKEEEEPPLVDAKPIDEPVINFIFSQPPCREVLLELAQNCNKITLPKSIVGPGFPPPHNQDTLISPNHSLNFQTKGLSNIWKKPRMKNLPFLISTISSKEDSHT
ncbi:hypothetical protein MTR_6g027990 [Medicago truncatula]|uniref:Uncharacterized protein n=1 Tax=Medicago truncatula TaxID=3880 RepID=A0A072U741_MEDTR|nr:hypothetical protein MTR_6g027990 [Medicago truncatula]